LNIKKNRGTNYKKRENEKINEAIQKSRYHQFKSYWGYGRIRTNRKSRM